MIGQRIYSTQYTHSRQINAIHSKVDDWLMDWKNSVKRTAPPAVYYILLIMCVCVWEPVCICSLHEARRRHSDISCVCHTDELTQPKPPSCSIDYILLLLLSPSRRPEKAKRERHTHGPASLLHTCVYYYTA
jgi:hypothetical protein